MDVHPRVAVDQMPVVRLTILQLHELRSQKLSTVRTNNRLNEESNAKNNDERRSQTPGSYHGVPLGGLEEREGKLHKNKKNSNQTRPPTTSQFWGSSCKRREGGRTILYGSRGSKRPDRRREEGGGRIVGARSVGGGGERKIPGAKP